MKLKILILTFLLLFSVGCASMIPKDCRIKARAKYSSDEGLKFTRYKVEFIWGFSLSEEDEEREKYETDRKDVLNE